MRMKSSFSLQNPNEDFSRAMIRMYKHIRALKGAHAAHEPSSHYASRIKTKKASSHPKMRNHLRLVK